DHEAIREMDKRIDDLKNKLFLEAQNLTSLGLSPIEQSQISLDLLSRVLFNSVEVIALEEKSKEYKKLVNQYVDELNKLPQRSLEFARLDRERQVNEKYYILMKTKFQESRITEASRISNVRIVDPAVPSERPVKPKKKMNLLLGIFMGLGLGVGIAFVKEYLDHTVRSSEDLQKLGLTTISIVPRIDIKSALEKIQQDGKVDDEEYALKSRLISHYDPKSTVAEAYRTLRTNIQFMSPDKPLRSMVVSSGGPGDGKSTTVANIAIAFANLEKKVLLIDADLRKPILHKVFDVPRGPGLTHRLVQDLNDQDVIRETQVPNLYLVTCGDVPPNPSELLASQKLKDFIARMKAEYDVVLLDSPPIIAVTDASILSTLTDAIMLVVNSGKTDQRVLKRSIDLLSQVNTNLIGAVLNGVNISAGYDSYYYYYHYYYYYADTGDKKKSSRRSRRKRPRLIDKIRA
ncbi:MAG: polysaccharide biosynthesis tyrosine autokinase, partial [Candidatus Marinimicrobia bacterium]|nr:polysaccharide biosynthesis tyrosine autokinase [Candidatus Neomarinimicrobiota bacterium]